MRLLYNGYIDFALRLLHTHSYLCPHFGWLNTPRVNMSYSRLVASRFPIAIDNSAFSGFCEQRFFAHIARIYTPVLWVAVPDVVGNAKKTLAQFHHYKTMVKGGNDQALPLAFVAQDGIEDMEIPWDEFACLFIGGSTTWKLSDAAYDLCREGKRKGVLVHFGRVNSLERLNIAYRVGCDSVDGSGFSRFSKKYLFKYLETIYGLDQQEALRI